MDVNLYKNGCLLSAYQKEMFILKMNAYLTVFIFETFPTSFLPKSKSIRCSDSSFLSFKSSCLYIASFLALKPLGLVPAIGLIVILSFLNLTRISGKKYQLT